MKPKLSIKETQFAIEKLKDIFSKELKRSLNLTRVSAPLFLEQGNGLNDTLNGEEPVTFKVKGKDSTIEVVHSLAKWKRHALSKYDFHVGEGIYTDMNAIRREEDLDRNHSYYVDQWDWEMVISKDQRSIEFLKTVVKKIFESLKYTEHEICRIYPQLKPKLPEKIFFISAEELYEKYPKISPEKREYEIVKEHKAIFVYGVGYDLKDGQPHSKRAKDYDDWTLNGDLIVYDSVNDQALEISSMGIRVDEKSIVAQYGTSEKEVAKLSPFHEGIIKKALPLTIGGGIGQSRIAMFLLEKKHIGEVQVSVWDDKHLEELKEKGIQLL